MQAHNLIGPTMVVGEGQPFIAALITLDPDALGPWATLHRKPGNTVADLRDDPDLHAEIQAAVDDANSAVSKAESIRRGGCSMRCSPRPPGTSRRPRNRSEVSSRRTTQTRSRLCTGRVAKSRSARWFGPPVLQTPIVNFGRTPVPATKSESPCGPRIGCQELAVSFSAWAAGIG